MFDFDEIEAKLVLEPCRQESCHTNSRSSGTHDPRVDCGNDSDHGSIVIASNSANHSADEAANSAHEVSSSNDSTTSKLRIDAKLSCVNGTIAHADCASSRESLGSTAGTKEAFTKAAMSGTGQGFMAPRLTRNEWSIMVDDLIGGYSDKNFQMKLHTRWYMAPNKLARSKVQQRLCLEIQKPILAKFGFEPSTKGNTFALASFFRSGFHKDEELVRKFILASWLVDPQIQAIEPKGPSGRWTSLEMQMVENANASGTRSNEPECEYQIEATSIHDKDALHGVDVCRATLVGEHHQLYKAAYPELPPEAWLYILGCENHAVHSLTSGGVVLHAKRKDTGQVVGYIFCTCHSVNPHHAAGKSHAPTQSRGFCTINHIVVLPEHRSRRVGTKLFASAFCFLQDITSPSFAHELHLSVLELNHDAIAWYKRLGFSVTDTDDVDLVVMGCPVKLLSMRRIGKIRQGAGILGNLR